VDLALAHRLIKLVAESQPQGAILVFLPGWFHITRLQERLMQCAVLGNVKTSLVLPLHSQVRTSPMAALPPSHWAPEYKIFSMTVRQGAASHPGHSMHAAW
jgi:hypothetical protein